MQKEVTLSQSNVLTQSRIEYTALERNIFYMVLSKITKDPQDYYFVSVRDVSEKTGVSSPYEEYKNATERLTGVVYSFKRPENGNLLQVSLFASCEYIKGQGLIKIELSKQIHPYFFELKNNFTMYQLEVALTLKSKYSKRLYEILSQWRDGAEKTFDILDLKRMLDLYNPKTKVEEYRDNFTDLKRKVLDVAQNELKKINADIQFSYKPNKYGRKFTSITFKITSKAFQTKIDFQDEEAIIFAKLVNKYKLRKDQAEEVMTNFEMKIIKDYIYQLDIQIINNQITNRGAYTAKMFGLK